MGLGYGRPDKTFHFPSVVIVAKFDGSRQNGVSARMGAEKYI